MMYKYKTKPFPHQEEAFDIFKDDNVIAVNGDMGIGKSKIAIDIVSYRYQQGTIDNVLIIAPNGVHDQWVTEQFEEHCPVEYLAHVKQSKTTVGYLRTVDMFMFQCKADRRMRVLAVNIESLHTAKGMEYMTRFIKTSSKGCAIIVDEASTIKNPDIKTTKNVKATRKLCPDALRITLTGTPAAKGPVNLWSIYDFLSPNYMGCSYIAFRMTHTVVYTTKRWVKGRLVTLKEDIKKDFFDKVKGVINNYKATDSLDEYAVEDIKNKFGLSHQNFWHIHNSKYFMRYKNLDRLHDKIAPVTFSRKKSDCLELPPKIYKVVKFGLNPHQKELIKSLQKYAIAMYNDEELTLETQASLGLRVLQICGGFFAHHTDIEGEYGVSPIKGKNAKLDYIKQDLMEVGEEQSIIWAVYTEELKLLYNAPRIDYSVELLDGSVTGDDRAKIVKAFKAGEVQHLIAHPEVGGFGYNFQNASMQYWYTRNYRTEKRIQAEDRNYRIGTTKSPIYKDLLYNIPFEQIVYDVLKDEALINEQFISQDPSAVKAKAKYTPVVEDIFKLK